MGDHLAASPGSSITASSIELLVTGTVTITVDAVTVDNPTLLRGDANPLLLAT